MNPKIFSSVESIARFCGSIKLAMLLLAVIIVASIFGTFVESGFNAAVAQAYIYDAPWFIAWLLLLCVNLVAAVLVRYPWKSHQYGFVLVHGGIVVILAGAIIGRIWGVEGNINLRRDGGPQNFLVVNETYLQVQRLGEPLKSFPLRLNLREPSRERPMEFRTGDVEISVLEMAGELGVRRVVEPDGAHGSPALRLIMTGDAAPHPIDQWLVKNDSRLGRISLGPNMIRFSGDSKNPGPAHGSVGAHAEAGHDACCPTAAEALPAYIAHQGDERATVGSGEPAACCPDDAIGTHEGRIAEVGRNHEHEFPDREGRHAERHNESIPHPVREDRSGNLLEFSFEDNRWAYRSRTADGEKTGVITAGGEFSAGWPGWRFRVEEVIERAVLRDEIGPMKAAGMRGIGASGLLIRLDDGKRQVERWIQMGSMAFLSLGGEHFHAAFGYRLHPLDFTVELDRFEVEFNPGTQTPSSFKSHVTFSSGSGETLSRTVWMNNPTNFPHFPGAGLLGTSYKFSQSSWNPGDLSQTTLQVIRDPGWSLKWIGSLLFCVGLLMMFYLTPYPNFARRQRNEQVSIAVRVSKAKSFPIPVRNPRPRERKEAPVTVS